MRSAFYILACALLTGCTPPGDAPNPSAAAAGQPDVRHVAATYRNLKPMTKEPVLVDRGLAMLCRGATLGEVDAARKVSGPHAHTAVSVFMNDLAAGAFGKPSPSYPVGSIIVKEKKAIGYRSTTRPGDMTKAADGVGGMIKRPAGYDPSHGDWEYFYFEDPARIETGRISSCVQCHSGAADRDYVFGGWAGDMAQ
jgi:Cytochrome P460